MRSIRKNIVLGLLLLLVGLVIACLCACNTKDDNSGNNQGGNNETPTHTHTLSLVSAKSADCVNSGNSAYYTCTCGKWFTDSNATTEITDKSSVVIGALGHKYSTEWSQSKTQHWHECSVCGNKKDLENHTAGTAATETTAQVCTVCDYVLTAPLGHTHKAVLVPAKAVDCEVDGNIEYYTCTCGKWFTDSNATTEITDKSSVVLTATGHSYSSEWSYSSTQHWYSATCKHTDEKDGLLNHDFQDDICSVCKYSVGLLNFNTLQLGENDTVYGKVSNDTTSFSFLKEVTANNGATYTVCTDMACTQTVPSKTVSLQVGDNTFYILSERGNDLTLFTVTIRRRPIHTVTFQTSGTAVSSQSVEEDSFAVKPDETTKIGYTFDNWTYGGKVVSFPYTITENISFTAEFTANEYTATLDVNGGDNLEKSEFSATYDELFSFVTPTRKGYTFLGWYDGKTKVNDKKWNYAEDKTFTAKWQVNSYELTVNYDNYSHGSVTGSGTYDYESSVTITATTKAGYTFIGWYNDENLLNDNLSYTFAMPAENVTYTAKWCKVSTESNDTSAGSFTLLDSTYLAGEEITLTATINEGYNFVGWYNGETLLTNDLICTVKMPSVDTVYTAKWNYFTVTTLSSHLGAGTVTSYNNTKISAESSVTITATETENLGYIWLGWYNDDELLATEYSYTFSMVKENVIFTATWKVWDGLEIFDFTSTTTELTITGLKDKSKTDITIPYGVTAIGNAAFALCNSLTNVTIPDSVTAIGASVFAYCSNLKNINIPKSITEISVRAFSDCIRLTSIIIPNSITLIGGAAFYGCTSLTNIIIPDSVLDLGHWYDNIGVFENCTSLISVAIGNGINTIYKRMFYGCNSLKSIILPDITSVGNDVFYDCNKIEAIYYTGTATEFFYDSGNVYIGDLYIGYYWSFEYVTFYFYSEVEPTNDGNYWHYDTDGVTPIVWEKDN